MPITLIGVINTGSPDTSVAVFGPSPAKHVRVGQQVEGLTLDQIHTRGVYLIEGRRRTWLWSGSEWPSGEPSKTIHTGIESSGTEIKVARDLRDYVVQEGLLTVLMQAASRQERGPDGEIIGYSVFDMDQGSVYEMAGLEDGDIVVEIDGVPASSPLAAIKALTELKTKDSFSFAFIRGGVLQKRNVSIR